MGGTKFKNIFWVAWSDASDDTLSAEHFHFGPAMINRRKQLPEVKVVKASRGELLQCWKAETRLERCMP
jgi:hypothetical protein